MDFLQKLYQNGGDACELLRLVRENFQLDDGWNVVSYVEQLRRQKSELATLYGATAKHNTDADKLHYETEITQHDEAISRAEKLALNDLRRKLSDGVFYGLGYPSPDANIRLIPLKEWAFLELDIDRSTATFQEIVYAGIRFISCDFYRQELKKLSYEGLLAHRGESTNKGDDEKFKPQKQVDEQIKQQEIEPEDDKLRLEKQLDAILAVIKNEGYDQMKIPRGGKKAIQRICEKTYPLEFNCLNSFDEAWYQGRSRELFRMADHASYAKRRPK